MAQPTIGGNGGALPVAEPPASSCIAELSRLSQPPAQWFYGQGKPCAARAHAQGTRCSRGGKGITITPSPLRQPPALWGMQGGRVCP